MGSRAISPTGNETTMSTKTAKEIHAKEQQCLDRLNRRCKGIELMVL